MPEKFKPIGDALYSYIIPCLLDKSKYHGNMFNQSESSGKIYMSLHFKNSSYQAAFTKTMVSAGLIDVVDFAIALRQPSREYYSPFLTSKTEKIVKDTIYSESS